MCDPCPLDTRFSAPGALFRFEGTLQRFLVPARGPKRKWLPGPEPGLLLYPVSRSTSIKDAIEAMGPPHPIIGSIDANGSDVDFTHRLAPGDRITVLPLSPPVDVTLPTTLRPHPYPCCRFAVDANVGKLASKLLALGYDVLHDPSLDDPQLADIAAREERIVVSKDRGLLKRNTVTHAFLVDHEDPEEQLISLLSHFGLTPPFAPFSRCLGCNRPLEAVSKESVLHLLEPLTRIHYTQFRRCPSCGKVFWRGSHAHHLEDWLERLTRRLSGYTRP